MLFQVHFLALLLEERGAGSLADVADHCAAKLVRRHPHVFGDVEAEDAATVLRNWDDIKRTEGGGAADPFGDLPETMPATIYARKVQRRVAASERAEEAAPPGRLSAPAERLEAAAGSGRDERFEALGELLYAAVSAARELGVDAELALREAANRRVARASAPGSGERGRMPAADE